jgi:hypothetical protein
LSLSSLVVVLFPNVTGSKKSSSYIWYGVCALGYSDFDLFRERDESVTNDGCKLNSKTQAVFRIFEPFRERLASKIAKSAHVSHIMTQKYFFYNISIKIKQQNLKLFKNPLKTSGKKVRGNQIWVEGFKYEYKKAEFEADLKIR